MRRWKPARLSRKEELERAAPLPPLPSEAPVTVRAAGNAGRAKALGLLDPASEAARALGAWRAVTRMAAESLGKALETPDRLSYALVYAASGALLFFVLSLFGSGARETSKRDHPVVFAKADPAPVDSVPEDPVDSVSGLDMVTAPSIPSARPALPPEAVPAAEPPQDSTPPPASGDDGRPDWAAAGEPAKQDDAAGTGSAPARRALAPIDMPRDAASQAATSALLTLGRVEARSSRPPASPEKSRAARSVGMGHRREFRDLVGRMYGRSGR